MTALLEFTDVQKSFRSGAVLRGVTATLEKGQCHAIVGPNGAGKSVLLKLVCNLMRPDSGTIVRDPSIGTETSLVPGAIGAVIDRPAFLPFANGFDNLRSLASILKRVDDSGIRATLEEVGLDPNLQQMARSYSLGMKQKLGLAQALMEWPVALVLDEPFNALDRESVQRVRAILRARIEAGTTVIFTSHNPDDVAALADRVWALEDGKLTTIATNRQDASA